VRSGFVGAELESDHSHKARAAADDEGGEAAADRAEAAAARAAADVDAARAAVGAPPLDRDGRGGGAPLRVRYHRGSVLSLLRAEPAIEAAVAEQVQSSGAM